MCPQFSNNFQCQTKIKRMIENKIIVKFQNGTSGCFTTAFNQIERQRVVQALPRHNSTTRICRKRMERSEKRTRRKCLKMSCISAYFEQCNLECCLFKRVFFGGGSQQVECAQKMWLTLGKTSYYLQHRNTSLVILRPHKFVVVRRLWFAGNRQRTSEVCTKSAHAKNNPCENKSYLKPIHSRQSSPICRSLITFMTSKY